VVQIPVGSRRSARAGGLVRLTSVLLLVAVWIAASYVLGTSSTGYQIVPSIPDVLGSYIRFAGYWPGGFGAESTLTGAEPTLWGATLGLIFNTFASALRVMVGYSVGVGVGLGLAVVISYSTLARQALQFPAHFARMMPLLAMLPLFALWFGNSEVGTVSFVAFAVGIVVFPITLNAIANVPAYYRQYAASLGANRLRTYFRVVIPAAFPQVRSAILLGVAFSWSAVLAAEFLGKSSGLGHIINFALYYAATDFVALTGLVVIFISAITYVATAKLLNWMTRWAE
jgi:sulfonate transport system permease protein